MSDGVMNINRGCENTNAHNDSLKDDYFDCLLEILKNINVENKE